MSDDHSPLPPSPPRSAGLTLPIILSILFVVFVAGTFIGFDMCAKSNQSDQTGFYIFIVSAAGLGITTLVGFISLLVVIIRKLNSRPQ